MFYENDAVRKQKIVGDLNKYIMSQKQVAEHLKMARSNLFIAISKGKLKPLYVFDHNSSRKLALFYRKDVEAFLQNRDMHK